MTLTNVNGTSQLSCSCGSWLEHWEKFSGTKATYCSVTTCYNKANLVGAHVQKQGDSKWYICPLCNSHNQSDDDLVVPDGTILVSANKSETCERRSYGYYR